ncbi:sulfatase-like hydrolase/transferase [Microbacterium aquimaris]|uniref:sulfatase-like hydrolase/transferase n=1 Tax=Microbacterium aquimaris TaxID=459816 RepID=UPI002AD55EB8|nr:sulfatase-like hydrolase/transferase [Microbacterium aquimaris]MDZ8275266.1 sulfatase-like hydrolase/transferase [Microbacterium aquimaris]
MLSMAAQPNILVFMTDQQRGETLWPGHRLKARTPCADRFAARALSFRQAFTTAPHCSPSRASFFTGLYPSEHGVWNNVSVVNALTRGPREGVTPWSRELVARGYDLAFSGKWHVSNEVRPADEGWIELMLAPPQDPSPGTQDEQRRRALDAARRRLRAEPRAGEWGARAEGEIVRPGWSTWVHYGIDERPYDDDDVVLQGIDFIERKRDDQEPWMLYVGTLGPHDPYTPPQRFLDLYPIDEVQLPPSFPDAMHDKPAMYRRIQARFDQLTEREQREALRHYLAFCSYEDWLFGQLLDALERTGQARNTAVLYLSDHGDYAGDHGLWAKGLPAFDGAYRIPAVISWPGMAYRPRDIDGLVSMVDIAETIRDIAGLPASGHADARSLRPWFEGRQPERVRVAVHSQTNGNEVYGTQRVVRTARWKLVCNFFDEDELYDLAEDPEETNNLIAISPDPRCAGQAPLWRLPERYRGITRDLYQRMWRHALAVDDEILDGYILAALGTFGPLEALDVCDRAPSS